MTKEVLDLKQGETLHFVDHRLALYRELLDIAARVASSHDDFAWRTAACDQIVIAAAEILKASARDLDRQKDDEQSIA